MKLESLQEKITHNKFGCFTILALISAMGIFANSIIFSSFVLGILFTAIYSVINSILLGHIFFHNEKTGFRIAFGFLLLVMLIALGGVIAMYIVAFEIFPIRFDIKIISTILCIITSTISFMNHMQTKPKVLQR